MTIANLIKFDTTANSKATARKRRKRTHQETQSLHFYLSIRPIYPKEQKQLSLSDLCTTKRKQKSGYFDAIDQAEEEDCLGDDDSEENQKDETTRNPKLWTTLALPAVLGRRNLVQAWWMSCPNADCQAHEQVKSATTCSRLLVCAHCKPLLRKRHLLALSKAMVAVSLDGSVTVTARHKELVRFESNPKVDPNRNTYARPNDNDGAFSVLGTLSVGKSVVEDDNDDEEDSWMMFQLRLQTKADEDSVNGNQKGDDAKEGSIQEQDDENRKESQKPNPFSWQIRSTGDNRKSQHQSVSAKRSPSKKRPLLSSRQHRRRRQLWPQGKSNNSSSEEDEEDETVVLPVTEITLVTDSPARRKLQFGGKHPSRADRASSDSETTAYQDEEHMLQSQESRVQEKDRKKTRNGPQKFSEAIAPPIPQPSPLSQRTTTPHSGKRIQKPRLVTPEHIRESAGQKRHSPVNVDESSMSLVRESQHKRRRLADLEAVSGRSVSATIQEGPQQEEPTLDSGSPGDAHDEETTPDSSSRPISQTKFSSKSTSTRTATNTANVCHGARASTAVPGMLSLPDDRSQSTTEEDDRSGRVKNELKEVATQRMSLSPERKLVKDLTLEDWKHLLKTSASGSFQRAVCDLVLAKNLSQNEDNGDLWLPSIVDPDMPMELMP